MRRIVSLVVLAVVVAGAWFFRDELVQAYRSWRGGDEAPVPSEAIAAQAESKLTALRDGTTPRTALSSVELESLLLYRHAGVLPAFLDSPHIELDEDALRLRARVPLDKLPRVDMLGDAAAFLPDTTELAVTGSLLPLDSGRVAFAVDDVSASRIPLPVSLVTRALERLGRRDEPGLPQDAMALPLPPGVGAAYIRSDSLVLLARPGSTLD